jgi:hypothetical protein
MGAPLKSIVSMMREHAYANSGARIALITKDYHHFRRMAGRERCRSTRR